MSLKASTPIVRGVMNPSAQPNSAKKRQLPSPTGCLLTDFMELIQDWVNLSSLEK